jgi:O-acetyl-ADP-ribose deacetylase (regulator of RNase III)
MEVGGGVEQNLGRFEMVRKLIDMLLEEMPHYRQESNGVPPDFVSQRRLFRSLMNVRPPLPLRPVYLALQDNFLSAERDEKGIVAGLGLPTMLDQRIAVWQGDITRLQVDAIVNAANSALLGCFYPCHTCIDNAIHSSAGLQVRDECNRIMIAQGHDEPVGQAKITRAYNLPSTFILHTVGPMIQGPLTQADRDQLASCYRSCLEMATTRGLESIAFCCISTGEYHFPKDVAAEIAVKTVKQFLDSDHSIRRVIFDVYKEQDLALYHQIIR